MLSPCGAEQPKVVLPEVAEVVGVLGWLVTITTASGLDSTFAIVLCFADAHGRCGEHGLYCADFVHLNAGCMICLFHCFDPFFVLGD